MPEGSPGRGFVYFSFSSGELRQSHDNSDSELLVINLIGQTHMRFHYDSPFSAFERILKDAEIKKLGGSEKIVIDSRLAFHWIPESFKVYLDLPPEVAKGRILNNLKENPLRKESENAETHEEVYEKIIHRLESEKKRYKELYGVDHTKKENFNLVIDTNKNNLEQVADIIVSEYKKWLTK